MSEERWKQRYQNFLKAYAQLEEVVAQKELNKFEKAGLIQTFEFTFELAWKTLKDYLNDEGFSVSSPKDTIRQAFQSEYISDGRMWLEALDARNLMAHTYEQARADHVVGLIKRCYFGMIKELRQFLQGKVGV